MNKPAIFSLTLRRWAHYTTMAIARPFMDSWLRRVSPHWPLLRPNISIYHLVASQAGSGIYFHICNLVLCESICPPPTSLILLVKSINCADPSDGKALQHPNWGARIPRMSCDWHPCTEWLLHVAVMSVGCDVLPGFVLSCINLIRFQSEGWCCGLHISPIN